MKKGSKLKLLGLTLAGLGAVMSSEAMAGDVVVRTDGGLKVYDVDGDFWFKLNGRLHMDQTMFNGSNADRSGYPSGSNIRRARLSAKGGFYRDWAYKFQLEFSETSPTSHILEAFLAWTGNANSTWAIGQFAQPVGMENWSSSNWWTFLEPALPTAALTPGLGLGVYADWHGDMVTLAGTLTHPADDFSASFGSNGSDELAYTGRFTFSPVHTRDTVWHFGGSYHHADMHDNHSRVVFATAPEAFGRGGSSPTTTFLSTGNINNVHDVTTLGLEAAAKWGPMSVQAEYLRSEADRDAADGGDVDFHGYYLQATYTLTGEGRNYDFASGTFGPVRPKSPCGAWEVAARYSYVNLNDENVMGGSEHNFTVGLNWYVNYNLRFMANYVFANLHDNVDLDILGLRAQVVW